MRRKFPSSLDRVLGFASDTCTRHAIIKPGPLVAEARGILGGVVFSRNRGGLYMRNFAAPVNPNTARQVGVRNAFAELVVAWNNELTFLQRIAWNDYADGTPQLNKLGQSIFLTGANWFVRINVAMLQGGLVRVDDAPAIGASVAPDPTFFLSDMDPVGNTIDFDFDTNLPWVGTDGAGLLLYARSSASVGEEDFAGRYRFAGVVLGDALTPPTSPATVADPWTRAASGEKITGKGTICLPTGVQARGMQSPYLPT